MRSWTLFASAAAVASVATAFAAVTPPPPPPTFPPPAFNGYIMLAQFNCDTFECTAWELDVTRLATECFTWDCQYEQQIQAVLDPQGPTAKRDFAVYTAAHHPTRTFYTVGLTKSQSKAEAVLWTAHVSERMTNSTVRYNVTFRFPSPRDVFVSLEAHPVSGRPLALFQDGVIAEIDPATGAVKTVGNFLNNFTRMANQATVVDTANGLLYAFTRSIFGSEPQYVTYDLVHNNITRVVPFPWLPYQVQELTAFQLSWIPEIGQLIMFSTGKFDQLIYVDPTTGAASYAVEDLMELSNLGFQNDPSVRDVDTLKVNAYDPVTHTLYFQASKYSQDQPFPVTSLVSAGPFTPGSTPAPLPWVNINLSPLNFGYQGYHYFHCHDGACPT